jgi:hypothetical protein
MLAFRGFNEVMVPVGLATFPLQTRKAIVSRLPLGSGDLHCVIGFVAARVSQVSPLSMTGIFGMFEYA